MGCRNGIAGRREDVVGRKIETRRMGDERSQTARDSASCEAESDLLVATDGWRRETGQSPSR